MENVKTVIILETEGEGVKVEVKDAFSPDHAIYILTQAIQSILIQSNQRVEEVVEDEEVSELSTAYTEAKEEPVQ